MKQYGTLISLLLIALMLLAATGCETDRQNKALLGAALGAAIGQAAGHDTQATLIGAGVGGAAGYALGEDEPAGGTSTVSQPAAGNTISMWITNSNGSQTQVKLIRNADGSYTGPKGERYAAMPTEEQLKQAYGF